MWCSLITGGGVNSINDSLGLYGEIEWPDQHARHSNDWIRTHVRLAGGTRSHVLLPLRREQGVWHHLNVEHFSGGAELQHRQPCPTEATEEGDNVHLPKKVRLCFKNDDREGYRERGLEDGNLFFLKMLTLSSSIFPFLLLVWWFCLFFVESCKTVSLSQYYVCKLLWSPWQCIRFM